MVQSLHISGVMSDLTPMWPKSVEEERRSVRVVEARGGFRGEFTTVPVSSILE